VIEQGIREILFGDSTINGLCGDRIRPMIGSQDDIQPRIVFQVTGDEPVGTYTGASAFSVATVEIDAIADTYKECVALAGEIKRVLDWVKVITTELHIAPSRLTDETDVEQALIVGTAKPVFLKTLTFELQYRSV